MNLKIQCDSSRKIRFGIIGSGAIAAVHAESIKHSSNANRSPLYSARFKQLGAIASNRFPFIFTPIKKKQKSLLDKLVK